MKEKLQTKFATRQYMISDTFELYYYSTDDVPGVKEHTHTHYEFYLFLEGAISLEIDGVLYTPTPGDLLLIPPGVPHHLVMHDLSVPYRRFVFWVSTSFAEQLRARSADYVYLMEYAAENQKYLFPLDSVPHHPPDRRNAVRSFWKRDADFSLRQRPADADQPNGV